MLVFIESFRRDLLSLRLPGEMSVRRDTFGADLSLAGSEGLDRCTRQGLVS